MFLLYIDWDGESPARGGFQIVTGYSVSFNPLIFSVPVALWSLMFRFVLGFVEPKPIERNSVGREVANDKQWVLFNQRRVPA